MEITDKITKTQIREWLDEIPDPEIPVISLMELGVVRDVHIDGNRVQVDITPTYSGCPAMRVMEEDIHRKLREKGIERVITKTVLSPAWTTDWLSDDAKQKLKKYGIAPPGKTGLTNNPIHFAKENVPCPFCDSTDTKLESQFGSTACKSLYYCNACQQPFEHFKCI